jgi:hypothetical protein
VVQRHYELNRREIALQRFLKAALSRVVEPMQKKQQQLPPQPERR